MGRHSWSDRSTVEDSKVLDIFWLRKNNYLCGYRSGTITWSIAGNVTGSIGIQVEIHRPPSPEGWARLFYASTKSSTGEVTQLDYKITLVTTRCHYGSYRWWFLCLCGDRVGKLYLPPGVKYFGCRSCYSLTYESCRESHGWAYRFAKAHGATLGQMKKALRR